MRDVFAEYKMLTDRVNVKFVRTYGSSTNMNLNTYNPIPAKTYAEDTSIDLPPEIDVKVYVKGTTSESVATIIQECKNVLYTFLQLKAGFHTNLYRSEIARYLHDTVDAVEFCEVIEPTDDIVYNFNINDIPKYCKDDLYTYCPEYIWFDKDNINIDVMLIATS